MRIGTSSLAVGVVVALSTLAGCAGPSPSRSHTTTQPWDSPVARPGLGNFAKVSPVLYRGEQPTAEGFRELEKLGVRTVVNLRDGHDDTHLLAGTNLRYIRQQTSAWTIDENDLHAFLKVVKDPANQPVFVHCQHGSDRTGFVVAGYRILEQNWDFATAEEELQAFGFHDIFMSIPRRLRKLAEGAKSSPPAPSKVVPADAQ